MWNGFSAPFAEVKKPEQALKLFVRFAIAKGVVSYGLELMIALFRIVQGVISTIMNTGGFGSAQETVLPLSTFAGEPSQNIGKSFLKSYAAVCLEGAVIVLACIIFSAFASSPSEVNPDAAAVTMMWAISGS